MFVEHIYAVILFILELPFFFILFHFDFNRVVHFYVPIMQHEVSSGDKILKILK